MADGLVLYPKSHRYKLDGQWVPGVTTIIKKGLPKQAIPYWSARTVAEWVADHPNITELLWEHGGRAPLVGFLKEVPWEKRDTAAVKGTDIHALAERLAHGDQVDVPPEIAGYVQSCVEFLDDWRFAPTLTERACASRRWQYAGTLDAVGTIADGRTAIVDWKSGSGVYDELSLQLAGYAHTEFYNDDDGNEQPMPPIDLGLGVHLQDEGYEVYELNVGPEAHRGFLYVQSVANLTARLKDWKSAPLPAPPTTLRGVPA